VASTPAANEKRRWRVKDTADSPWRDLPGEYTTVEILRMRIEGFFAAAIPADETPQNEAAPDD
jgi:hypothetical protein